MIVPKTVLKSLGEFIDSFLIFKWRVMSNKQKVLLLSCDIFFLSLSQFSREKVSFLYHMTLTYPRSVHAHIFCRNIFHATYPFRVPFKIWISDSILLFGMWAEYPDSNRMVSGYFGILSEKFPTFLRFEIF